MSVLALLVMWLVAPEPGALASGPSTAWPQWGGPTRNFVVAGGDLALTWPPDGPRRLWRRPLGDGLSAVVTDGAMLYTLYRDGSHDVVIALDATTGKTRWESRYEAPFNDTCSQQLGPAPRATPLIHGDRLVTVSAGGLMNAFDRRSGQLQWTYDLVAGTPDAVPACGYSSSPLAYKDRIITTAGGHRARGRVARGGHGPPRVADAGLRQRLLVAASDRSRRRSRSGGLHLR